MHTSSQQFITLHNSRETVHGAFIQNNIFLKLQLQKTNRKSCQMIWYNIIECINERCDHDMGLGTSGAGWGGGKTIVYCDVRDGCPALWVMGRMGAQPFGLWEGWVPSPVGYGKDGCPALWGYLHNLVHHFSL